MPKYRSLCCSAHPQLQDQIGTDPEFHVLLLPLIRFRRTSLEAQPCHRYQQTHQKVLRMQNLRTSLGQRRLRYLSDPAYGKPRSVG